MSAWPRRCWLPASGQQVLMMKPLIIVHSSLGVYYWLFSMLECRGLCYADQYYSYVRLPLFQAVELMPAGHLCRMYCCWIIGWNWELEIGIHAICLKSWLHVSHRQTADDIYFRTGSSFTSLGEYHKNVVIVLRLSMRRKLMLTLSHFFNKWCIISLSHQKIDLYFCSNNI